jgi:hypothetical protein
MRSAVRDLHAHAMRARCVAGSAARFRERCCKIRAPVMFSKLLVQRGRRSAQPAPKNAERAGITSGWRADREQVGSEGVACAPPCVEVRARCQITLLDGVVRAATTPVIGALPETRGGATVLHRSGPVGLSAPSALERERSTRGCVQSRGSAGTGVMVAQRCPAGPAAPHMAHPRRCSPPSSPFMCVSEEDCMLNSTPPCSGQHIRAKLAA